MSRPATPSTKPTSSSSRSHREDVLQFLDDLDSLEGSSTSTNKDGATSSLTSSRIGAARTGSNLDSSSNNNNTTTSLSNRGAVNRSSAASPAAVGGSTADKADDPQAVLDFLDEIVANRERRSATPVNASSTKGSSSTTTTTTSSSATQGSNVSRSGSRTTLREGEGGVAGRSSGASAIPSRKSAESTRSMNMTSLSQSTSSPAGHAAEKLQEAVPLASEQHNYSSSSSSSSAPQPAPSTGSGGGWGWGSVWSQASNVLQQAKSVAEEQAKHLPKNLPASITNLQSQLPVSPSTASTQAQAGMNAASAQAQKWRSGMMNMLSTQLDIDKLRKDIADTGMKAMQDIMNAVAPPIAEHEVIQVNLSHDMIGYEGVETLVYRALAKVMEQVEGGDLVVNKGHVEDSPSNAQKQPTQKSELGLVEDDDDDERNLNTVEGFVEGYKLAEANLEALIKKHYQKPEEPQSPGKSPSHGRKESGVSLPVTVCPVYMRIQPVIAAMPFATPSSSSANPNTATDATSAMTTATAATRTSDDLHLYFVMILRDPTNELVHKTLTQSMPSKWLDIPFEENEWVEDIMVDVIRRGVEIIGEEYIKGRMHGRLLKNAKAETIFEGADAEEDGQGLSLTEGKQNEDMGEKMSEAQAGVSA